MVALVTDFHAEAKPQAQDTAEWKGIALCVPSGVYGPREDSFLLAEAASKYAKGRVLDLGTGSGIVGIAAALKGKVAEVVSADVSQAALRAAKANAEKNGTAKKTSFVKTDLFSAIRGKFDTIAFNPPYLPVEPGEKKHPDTHTWDGGKTGRKVIDRFLKQFPAHLAPGGTLLFLSSSLSSHDKTMAWLKKRGFNPRVAATESFFFERISVIRAAAPRRKQRT